MVNRHDHCQALLIFPLSVLLALFLLLVLPCAPLLHLWQSAALAQAQSRLWYSVKTLAVWCAVQTAQGNFGVSRSIQHIYGEHFNCF